MLLDEYTAVTGVSTPEELKREVLRFTRWLGFEKMNATAVMDVSGAPSRFAWVNNTPPAFEPLACSFERAHRDPVARHAKHASTPIVWNQDTYTGIGLGEHWEEQAAHGYRTGIAAALHLPKGLHFFVGLDREEPLPSCPSEISRMAAALHLFVACAEESALRVLLPASRVPCDAPMLTSRELETLRWTMEGRTAWEVGRILGVSEQTAVRHLNNATHKLGCVNKHHAVVKALRLGLVQ